MDFTRKDIGLQTIVCQNRDILFSSVDNEAVLLSMEQNNYFGMDKVGSRIWEMINNPTSVEEIITALLEEFQVSREICEKDVIEFLHTLQEEKLITI